MFSEPREGSRLTIASSAGTGASARATVRSFAGKVGMATVGAPSGR